MFVAPTSKSLSHTKARKAATDGGARGATLPGVTASMLARLMACDFETLQRRSAELARLLTGAGEARITCPRGTDLRLDLTGRDGIADDGDLTGERAFGNLPCGEGFTSPLGAEGRMVTGCLASIGLPAGRAAGADDRGRQAGLREPSPRASGCSPRSTPPAVRAGTSPSSGSAPTSAPS